MKSKTSVLEKERLTGEVNKHLCPLTVLFSALLQDYISEVFFVSMFARGLLRFGHAFSFSPSHLPSTPPFWDFYLKLKATSTADFVIFI